MARYFATISEADFKAKLFDALKKNDQFDEVSEEGKVTCWEDLIQSNTIGNETFYHFNYAAMRAFPYLTKTVVDDIKVEFDLENTLDEFDHNKPEDPPHGVHTLDNGLTLFGMSAGGDWEFPVYFILYWDGKKIRGYVPTDGNPWNTDTKQAYGNDEEADLENAKKRYPDAKMDNYKGKDYFSVDDMRWEKDKIIADIKARILPETTKAVTTDKPAKAVEDISKLSAEEKLKKQNTSYAQALMKVRNSLNANFMEEESERLVALIDEAIEKAKQYV